MKLRTELRTGLAIVAALTVNSAAFAQVPAPADIVFVNGKVFTADDGDHVVQGFAVAGDRFVAAKAAAITRAVRSFMGTPFIIG